MVGISTAARLSSPRTGARVLFTTPPSPSDCFMAWIDSFNACTTATGGLSIPTEPTEDNAKDRAKICATPACQKLFTVFRSLIDTKCPGALNEVEQFPNGMYTTTFCTANMPTTSPPPAPTTPPPPTPPPPAPTTPPPTAPPSTTTQPPASPVTTPPPTSTTSVPTAAPVTPASVPTPNTTSPLLSSSSSSSSGSPVVAGPTATPVSPSTPPAELVTTSPVASTSPTSASKSGVSTTMIATAGGGGFVILVLVIAIFLLVRRKRSSSSHDDGTTAAEKAGEERDPGADYTNYSSAPTEDTFSRTGVLDGGAVLAQKRIPFSALRFGDGVSQGGFGEVLKGTYKTKVVAIKRLLSARREHKGNIHSFFKEIQLTSTLDHDCIVRFIGYAWDVPANLCMVSEYMDGGDLRTLMVKYKKSGHQNGHDLGKLRIAEQIARGLQYLHRLDPPVVHRDLKSRNVLLASEGENAKLIDFGISCERQDYTMTAEVGTYLWMAPEVMLGERYDEKADVFSFGVILSELDTHALPYDDTRDTFSDKKLTDVKLTQLISEGKIYPRFTEFANPAILALARDCLQFTPSIRPSAAEVVTRLARIRHTDGTNTLTGTRPDARTGTASSRAVSHDSVLSYGSQATTQSAGGRA